MCSSIVCWEKARGQKGRKKRERREKEGEKGEGEKVRRVEAEANHNMKQKLIFSLCFFPCYSTEPSTGMHPLSKRLMWRVIIQFGVDKAIIVRGGV